MKVRLSDYNQAWPEMYKTECREIENILGREIIRFEHFGSTSVEGMKAKPVIDMMVIVKNIDLIDEYQDVLISSGYDAAGEWGIPGRRLFRKGGNDRTHHIHIYEDNNPEVDRHLILRDYLRQNREERDAYSHFKECLFKKYKDTKDYSFNKKEYVSQLEKRALIFFNKHQK